MSEPDGLSTAQAAERLAQDGPNSVPQRRKSPLVAFVRKFWGPVPWMLEVSFVLELLTHRRVEATILAALVVVNAAVGFGQEHRANRALALLRSRLKVEARVQRDGRWSRVVAETLVRGDLVHVRMGDFVPADLTIQNGSLLLDRSTLTGESAPVDIGDGDDAHAGAVVRRGEATGIVVATGTHTAFGRTIELVREAKSRGHLEELIVGIVRALVVVDCALALIVLAIAIERGRPLMEIVPYLLMLLIASVPVALPATFTLATARGALDLARQGVLVTRLAALEEIAAMQVLCCDKTGTLTKNVLTLTATVPLASFDEKTVVELAALASDEATQDSIDLAILGARGNEPSEMTRLDFIPFDPATKRAEARVVRDGVRWRIAKGTPSVIASLARVPVPVRAVEALAQKGCRVLAVAAGPEEHIELVGLLGLLDPPRDDSKALVEQLRSLGLRVIMVTGDTEETAVAVAKTLGIGDRASTLVRDARDVNVLAGIIPEDKFRVVKALQQDVVVGMTGDGVNDAPALRQADVGIAVSNATDVAKAAASVVLTHPGLGGVVSSVYVGREIYQRMLTYTLNKITKTLMVSAFLTLGYFWLGTYVVTPTLVLLLLLTNDFVTMSLATDRVVPSQSPDRWGIAALLRTSTLTASFWLVFAISAALFTMHGLRATLPQVQTVAFLSLVFTGQANVYLLRERRYLWRSRPSAWMLTATAIDIAIVCAMATRGVLMEAVAPQLVAMLLGVTVIATLTFDAVKVRIARFET